MSETKAERLKPTNHWGNGLRQGKQKAPSMEMDNYSKDHDFEL